jgi:hypothetical protein
MMVYTVVYYDERAEGATGDGILIARFRSKRAALAFAQGKECYGKPADVDEEDAPPRLVNRWSFLG